MHNLQRHVASRLCLAIVFPLLLAIPAVLRAADPAKHARTVVMVSVDGLAAFYMDDPKADMPTIRALAEAGAWAPMQASAPTVTWPNHTNLVTGVTSAKHGVVGNEYFDREQKKSVPLILDPFFDKEEIIRVPTIYDVAHGAGMKTAGIRWPASRNAKTLDWGMPEVGSNKQLHEFTTPELVAECKAAGIWADGEKVRSGSREVEIVSDDASARVFHHILRTHRPNLALLHLIHVDHMEHVHGPRSPEAYEAIHHADLQVREIWDILKRDYPDTATLLVVSDHGFAPIEHVILPNVVLRDLGLVQVEGDQVVDGTVRIVIQGGALFVYVLDDDKRGEIIAQVRKAFEAVPGIGKIAGPDELKDHGVASPADDPHAPDMILFAAEGFSYSDKASGSKVVIDDTPIKGTHGHDEHLPNLQATFVAWGAGIKPGSRPGLIKNIDVAPTIAELLGLNMQSASGKPVAAALAE